MSSDIDPEQLTRLFESRYDLVLGTARRYAPDWDLTHDIVQQTFLILIQGVLDGKWKLDENVNLLLYGITKKVALKLWSQEQKNTPYALRIIHERFLADRQEPVDKDGSDDERLSALKTCLEKLPIRSRSFLEQYYRDGIRIGDIGKQNDIPAGTIRQMFTRLRTKLRECIDRVVKESDP